MRAQILVTPGPIESKPLTLKDVAVPEPGPGEVLIRVTACGVCRSNLHMIEGDWVKIGVPAISPIIPGHEVVGKIDKVGAGVDWLKVGDRVGVQPLWSTCGHCEFCLTAREQLCQSANKKITGENRDGGYAEYMLGYALHTYKIPDSISDEEAAPLFCPGVTAYGAVHKAHLQPGQTMALFGIGGVGHMVLQFAALTGADMIGVARGKNHLKLAKELGCSRTIDANDGDAGETLKKSGGVDVAIVFAPSTPMLRQAIAATKPGGKIVVGTFTDPGPFFFPDEKQIIGSVIGSRWEMENVLKIAGAGKVKAHIVTFPLEKTDEALRQLKGGEIEARAVLTM
ncbi:MAG: alcohol dehydrogenase catalytic domain-containing protein [Candidatus Velthaea sp.]|jgi:propanol-preferring alcohol dehydrogenase